MPIQFTQVTYMKDIILQKPMLTTNTLSKEKDLLHKIHPKSQKETLFQIKIGAAKDFINKILMKEKRVKVKG